MKVLIVGGGIGGFSLALSLHAAGIDDVEVFEASPVVEELGVGINVLPHAVRELTELGLADELSAVGLATSEFVMFNKHGQRIWAEPRGLAAGYRWPQYSIHRGHLLGILHRAFCERMGAARLHTGCRVVRCSQDGTSVSARFTDRTTVGGDVLVAADGVHSTVRGQLFRHEGPALWNGITMWRAVVRAEPFLSGSSMVIIGHFGRRAVIYPIASPGDDGCAIVNIVLEARTDRGRPMPRQDWSHRVDRDEVRALFGWMRFDWIDVAMLIEAADQWWQYPMVDRDPLTRWSFGRMSLLGDAAHPMYPVGANGASQAILDARTLARTLAVEGNIDAALDAYESVRRPATAAVVLSNRQVGAEKCMELAEERAPHGFQRVEEVFAPGELERLSAEYKRTAGFDPVTLNERPSLSVVAARLDQGPASPGIPSPSVEAR
jgi:2-polyprenyl-6-methoxyphenol hydroxylase-like FAD-dependent oxidoreductase